VLYLTSALLSEGSSGAGDADLMPVAPPNTNREALDCHTQRLQQQLAAGAGIVEGLGCGGGGGGGAPAAGAPAAAAAAPAAGADDAKASGPSRPACCAAAGGASKQGAEGSRRAPARGTRQRSGGGSAGGGSGAESCGGGGTADSCGGGVTTDSGPAGDAAAEPPGPQSRPWAFAPGGGAVGAAPSAFLERFGAGALGWWRCFEECAQPALQRLQNSSQDSLRRPRPDPLPPLTPQRARRPRRARLV
jgi:hypothetical protein